MNATGGGGSVRASCADGKRTAAAHRGGGPIYLEYTFPKGTNCIRIVNVNVDSRRVRQGGLSESKLICFCHSLHLVTAWQ
jgi:hypothetical protein